MSIGEVASDLMSIPFYGLQRTYVRATPTGFEAQRLQVWFQSQDFFEPSIFTTTGGFDITMTP